MFPIAANRSDEENTTPYVDDVFSTTLYTGNGATQTITNGIDLAGKGGLVWIKQRNGPSAHNLRDTVRGNNYALNSALTNAQSSGWSTVFNFTSTGYAITGTNDQYNGAGGTYAAWTFRKAAKFFDVVTYTGDGVAGRSIAHSLGIAPGMVIVKKYSGTGSWAVRHRSATGELILDLTSAQDAGGFYTVTAMDASTFTVSVNGSAGNESGQSYVAYLFAHDTAADGIIQCGSFTTDGSGNATVNLGWEPQYLLIKGVSAGMQWVMEDAMRGMSYANQAVLYSNSSSAEFNTGGDYLHPTATGFQDNGTFGASQTLIYMAIRRPNKPPTTGTQVYNAIARTGTGAAVTVTGVGFAPDFRIGTFRSAATAKYTFSKLIAPFNNLATNLTRGENIDNTVGGNFYNDGFYEAGYLSTSGHTFIDWLFKRAPGFFDEVCYTGTGVATTQAHNLGVAPELMIIKSRTNAFGWSVYNISLGVASAIYLNSTSAAGGSPEWNSTTPTSNVFSISNAVTVNGSGQTYVAYLFATLAGISKVGSYTGNGSSQNIECGFAAGARFVLVKATSTTGDWLVADTARGIVSGNDPRLSLNSTAAEVTGEDWLDPYAPGFTVNQTTASANASGVSYIFLAIA